MDKYTIPECVATHLGKQTDKRTVSSFDFKFSTFLASFIYEKITGEKWSTTISATVDSFDKENKKIIQPGIKVDEFKYKSILNDEKFDFYRAMMEGRSEDSQGYTLLE